MKKFKIPKTPSSTNKSIRFPDDLIEQVEEAIRGQDCTFSAFVVRRCVWHWRICGRTRTKKFSVR